ncbi:MAG: glycosyltransferase family 9 protein [Nitrospira sp.]|nr:glycosyltransferase family 9 protein [Nitrospira sp.]
MKRTVLVFRVGQLGDTLIALPSVAAIRDRHPGDRLVLLTEQRPEELQRVSAWEVLGPTGWFQEVLYYQPVSGWWRKVMAAWKLLARLRRLNPDVIYNLAPERSLVQVRRDRLFFSHLVGARTYYGGAPLSKNGKGIDGVLPHIEPEWKRLLRIVGAEGEPHCYRLAVPEDATRRVIQRFMMCGLQNVVRVLAIGPGSKMQAKRWPVERFNELGRRLLREDAGLHLAVLGGREDSALGEALCRDWGERSHNFAGVFSVYESAAALKRCCGYLGNDTGTMHLAAMVGVPCVALFSARDYPGQWEPYGHGHVVLRHETDCAGCMIEVCSERDNECLRRISEGEVFVASRYILGDRVVVPRP